MMTEPALDGNRARGYTGQVPRLLQEIYRLQESPGFNDRERLLLKMFANILESEYEVAEPRNRMVRSEYMEVPGRWELIEGMLYGND